MGSRLLNVRLDEARLRKARRLRESGVTLSDVVREAIDARFAALDAPMTGPEARTMVARILSKHPDPPGLAARSYDVHDRQAARAAIARALKRSAR
jgi:hypothetical protein